MSLFQVFWHGLLVLFIRGVKTYCGGPNGLDSYPECFKYQIVQFRRNCFVEVCSYVYLDPLYVSSCLWWKINIIFARIEWVGNTVDSLLYYPTLKLQFFYTCFKGIIIFFGYERSNPVSPLTEDIKCITLTSIK